MYTVHVAIKFVVVTFLKADFEIFIQMKNVGSILD